MIKKIKLFGLAIISLLIITTACNKNNEEPVLTGTLTVLQKDAYSDIAGRTSDLWPPHTTVVFDWENGHSVQLNHGTAPDEVDANGTPYLVETIAYTFTGTKTQMEELQTAFEGAVYDDPNHKFLGLSTVTTTLEIAFILGLSNYLLDGVNGFPEDGDITKDSLVSLLDEGSYREFAGHLSSFSWTQENWTIALETVLGNVLESTQAQLSDYHVCNNDADLQVRLIKNYIATGEIEMPLKVDDGPMMFYNPN